MNRKRGSTPDDVLPLTELEFVNNKTITLDYGRKFRIRRSWRNQLETILLII